MTEAVDQPDMEFRKSKRHNHRGIPSAKEDF